MSLGVFILPQGEFEAELCAWKQRINDGYPNQKYTSHPPHLTLINLEVESEAKAIDAIETHTRFMKPLMLNITHTAVFWDDILTGGHTLYFGLDVNDELFVFQQQVANALSSLKKVTQPPRYFGGNQEFSTSYCKYGFPYVGRHWIPHFSVSSLQTEKENTIISEFLSSRNRFCFPVDELSVWRVDDNEHVKLTTIEF